MLEDQKIIRHFSKMILTWLIISTILYQANGACKNLLNNNTYVVVNSMGTNYTYYDCKQLVKQLPMACKFQKPDDPAIGGPDGLCCKKCPNNLTCFDYLSKFFYTTVQYSLIGTNKMVTKNIKSCSLLVSKYPALCRKDEYRNLTEPCCKACENIDPNAACYDELVAFKVGKKKLVCKDYVRKDKCRCANPQVKSLCCTSCETVDAKALNCCTNLLSKWNAYKVPYDGKNVTLKSCSVLAKHPYTVLCRREQFGGLAGQCCKICNSTDLSCLDDLGPFQYDNQMFGTCEKLINYNPCLCEIAPYNSSCCRACSINTNRSGCDCQDAPGTITVTMPDGTMFNTTCSEYITNNTVCNCINAGGICCASCDNKDVTGCNCTDNDAFASSIVPNETCSSLVTINPCWCLNSNFSDGCCESCSNAAGANCSCYDGLPFLPPGGSSPVLCPNYVTANPCSCVNVTNLPSHCCRSCAAANVAGCNCTDTDTFASSIVPNETCASLVTAHPCWCLNSNFSAGCCESCSNAAQVNCSCYDSFPFIPPGGGSAVSCSSYVSADNCNCVNVNGLSNICCASCAAANVTGCNCTDTDTFASSIVPNETCSSLVTANPCWCLDGNFSAGCCESCSNAAGANCSCYDGFPFYPSGESSTVLCSEYVNTNVCRCVDVANLTNQCCASCSAANTSECVCRDSATISVNGQPSNCTAFTQNPCNCLVNNTSTLCCASCQNADTSNCSCRDAARIIYQGVSRTCKNFTDEDPCNCGIGNASSICCESCTGVDVSNCCRDSSRIIIPTTPPTNTNCTAYINEDRCRCKKQQVRDLCCATCEAQGNITAFCSCQDAPSFQVNNVSTNCSEQISIDECRCEQLGSLCCASCDGRNLTYCQCRDTLDASSQITFPPGQFCTIPPIDNCNKVVSEYSHLCDNIGGKCCQSCLPIDRNCTDSVTCFGRLHNTKLYKSCKELTDAHICECDSANVRSKCCNSCSGFDRVASNCDCTDGLAWNYMNYTSPASNFYTDCATLTANEPSLCTTSNFVKNTLCCRACSSP